MHSCRKYWLIALSSLLLVFSSSLRAQDTLSFSSVDAQTYSLYTTENWDELIHYGNQALSKGIDYYYLRMRIGTAYYKRQNYRAAEAQFRKAMNFNSTDEVMEMLYYCYLWEGQYERARWLSKSFSPDAITATASDKLKAFSFANLEGGIGLSDHWVEIKNEYYGQASLCDYVSNRFSLFQAVTYYGQQIMRGQQDEGTHQFQYYAGVSVPLKNRWSFALGIQPIYANLTDSVTLQRPVGIQGPNPVEINNFSEYNIVGAASITKSFTLFNLTLGSAVALYSTTLNSSQYIPHAPPDVISQSASQTPAQYEHYAGITFYPLGNQLFSFGATGYMHTEDYYNKMNSAIVPYICAAPLKSLTLTLSYLTNKGANLIENNGYIVSGDPDQMYKRYSIIANYSVSSNISLYGAFQMQYYNEENGKFDFCYNLITTGIKYTPQ